MELRVSYSNLTKHAFIGTNFSTTCYETIGGSVLLAHPVQENAAFINHECCEIWYISFSSCNRYCTWWL